MSHSLWDYDSSIITKKTQLTLIHCISVWNERQNMSGLQLSFIYASSVMLVIYKHYIYCHSTLTNITAAYVHNRDIQQMQQLPITGITKTWQQVSQRMPLPGHIHTRTYAPVEGRTTWQHTNASGTIYFSWGGIKIVAALTSATIINVLRHHSLMLQHATAQQCPQLLHLWSQLLIFHTQLLHQTAIQYRKKNKWVVEWLIFLQCFDTVGWAAGRASGL